MDMWTAFQNSTLRHVPDAAGKIVFDNFHVAKHMNKAVDEVRRTEHAALQALGDTTLKGSRQLWLYGLENVPGKWAARFEALRQSAKVVRMLKSHWDNIVTYFRHRLCNAAAEGINSRIQQLIQQACGYRNRARFKRDVLFHLGGLDLHPQTAQ
jgi:transposase